MKRNTNISEYRPKFRSVVLGGRRNNPPPLQQTSTPPKLTRPSSIAGARIGSSYSRNEKLSLPCNPIISKNSDSNASDSSSVFEPTALRPVPFYYPIEKTSKVVEEEDLHTIASRVTHCMRDLSVQANYDNKNAKASLTTIEGVQMQLSLWDKSSKGTQKKKILVELQRCSGDCMTFHQYCRNILKAATTTATAGDNDDNPKNNNNNNSNKKRKINFDIHPPRAKKQSSSPSRNTSEEEEYENTIAALEIAHTLLMKDRMDAKQLGLESLCFLTDPNKSNISRTTKLVASQVVLFGNNIMGAPAENKKSAAATQVFLDIQETIAFLVASDPEPDEFAPEEEEKFNNLALTVFANALHSTTIGGSSASNDDGHDNIIVTLARALSHPEKISPHTSYLSTRCLRLLCGSSPRIKQKVLMELEGSDKKYDVIHTALNLGIRAHRKLELECKKFLEEIILLPCN